MVWRRFRLALSFLGHVEEQLNLELGWRAMKGSKGIMVTLQGKGRRRSSSILAGYFSETALEQGVVIERKVEGVSVNF